MIVKMTQNLGNRIDKIQEMFNKEQEELKEKKKNDEQYNKWNLKFARKNQLQNNWGRRTGKWPGKWNSGNNYCREE